MFINPGNRNDPTCIYNSRSCTTYGCGAYSREPWETDYSPTATSRVTHVAQCVVFGAVMSDAAMLDAVLELDVWGKERVGGGRRG